MVSEIVINKLESRLIIGFINSNVQGLLHHKAKN